MILLKILDHDLHRHRKGVDGSVLWIETPAKPSFLPAVVSLSTPKFGVSRKISNGSIRSGVFQYDQDRLDEVIPDLITSAYELSLKEKWSNIHNSPSDAFNWIQNKSGTEVQPHCVLIPSSWDRKKIEKYFGKSNTEYRTVDSSIVYKKMCRVYQCGVKLPVFLSRPDFVGMYTQILGGRSSILLHNIKNGIAFDSGWSHEKD
jgi:hypothetical protein